MSPAIRRVLAPKLQLRSWPYSEDMAQELYSEQEFDNQIEAYALNTAQNFLGRPDNEEEECEIQYIRRLVVQELILLLLAEPNKSLKAWQLRDKLGLEMKGQAFKMSVMARIRDEGVLLFASHNGYKLAATESDVQDYLNHTLATVTPWLHRIRSAMEHIGVATQQGYKPLATDPKYQIFEDYG